MHTIQIQTSQGNESVQGFAAFVERHIFHIMDVGDIHVFESISSAVMDIAPALLSVSEEQCKITEIYYLDKGNHEYQFTARVSRGGPGGFGIGKDLTITAKAGGDFDIVDNNHVTLYSGSDKIPGELIFGDADEASIARGLQILGNELGKLDVNGDGELSMDEIFEMN